MMFRLFGRLGALAAAATVAAPAHAVVEVTEIPEPGTLSIFAAALLAAAVAAGMRWCGAVGARAINPAAARSRRVSGRS